MEIGIDIYNILSTSSQTALSDDIDGRIYPVKVPLAYTQVFPYLVYNTVSDVPTNTKGPDAAYHLPNQKSPLDTYRLQISCFGNDYNINVRIALAVRAELDRHATGQFNGGPYIDSLVYDGVTELYEDKIQSQGVYHHAIDFIIRVRNISLI